MTDSIYTAAAIAVVAVVTALIRFAPFVIFGRGRKAPALVQRFGAVLPPAVMMMLVVYCLRDVSFSFPDGFLPQIVAGAAVVALQVWKRNSLISIAGGTVLYMFLIQSVF